MEFTNKNRFSPSCSAVRNFINFVSSHTSQQLNLLFNFECHVGRNNAGRLIEIQGVWTLLVIERMGCAPRGTARISRKVVRFLGTASSPAQLRLLRVSEELLYCSECHRSTTCSGAVCSSDVLRFWGNNLLLNRADRIVAPASLKLNIF